MISPYGKPQSTITALLGLAASAATIAFAPLYSPIPIIALIFGLAFFRDPDRRTPSMRGQAIAPSDGRISSIHQIEHFDLFDGPAVCIRIFLSVFDVHVNRSPLHGRVTQRIFKPGKKLNALKAESAELNESYTILLNHPAHKHPVAAVRQIAGAIARNIVCDAKEGDILQRGQRFGMIKYGSTTELYLPNPDNVTVEVKLKQYVYGAQTVLATTAPSINDIPQTVANTDNPSDNTQD